MQKKIVYSLDMVFNESKYGIIELKLGDGDYLAFFYSETIFFFLSHYLFNNPYLQTQ